MNNLQSDHVEEVIDQDGNSLNEKPEDQNAKWWEFLKYWKKRVYKLYGVEYQVLGGDKKRFHDVFKAQDFSYKKMTDIVEYYLKSQKAKDSDIQTIRAALSNHSLMTFKKHGTGVEDKIWQQNKNN